MGRGRAEIKGFLTHDPHTIWVTKNNLKKKEWPPVSPSPDPLSFVSKSTDGRNRLNA